MKITEGLDYYFDLDGKMVLTEHYLKNRGYCCENGCRHCPYGFKDTLPALDISNPNSVLTKDDSSS